MRDNIYNKQNEISEKLLDIITCLMHEHNYSEQTIFIFIIIVLIGYSQELTYLSSPISSQHFSAV